MDSEFDALMADADTELMSTFGSEVLLIEGAATRWVMADIERDVSVQRIGERRSVGGASRFGRITLCRLLAVDAPADPQSARLEIDGQRYCLAEPEGNEGEVEYLLMPEPAGANPGDRSTTFF